jgi:prevent-host-death family protein
MQVVTIREAKARLNALVEAAQRGEQVVLMRGSKHVAAIVPVSAEDLELSPHLRDPQAERFLAAARSGARRRSEPGVRDARGGDRTPLEAVLHLPSPPGESVRQGRAEAAMKNALTERFRIVLVLEPGMLALARVGTHEEIRRYLKDL